MLYQLSYVRERFNDSAGQIASSGGAILLSILRSVLILAVAMVAVAAFAGCQLAGRGASKESLGSSPPDSSSWAKRQGFADNPKAVAGAKVFARVGCAQCHTYLGTGSSNVGAPDLSSIGRDSPRSSKGFAAYVADPSRFGNNVMPHFEDLGRTRLLELGAFLKASKGPR